MVPRAILAVQERPAAVVQPIARRAPRPVTAPDIPALKERFLAGELSDQDWDHMVAILDAAEDRRKRNRKRQSDWRKRHGKGPAHD